MTVYILILLVFVLTILLLITHKSNTLDNHLETFIELNNNITVITSDTEILAMNRTGLDFFGFKTFKALHEKHKYLSKLFSEITRDDTKFVEGINWVTKIDKWQNIKVQMYQGNLKQTFYMQVSKIKEDRYHVTFYNISRVMAEKDAITKVAQKDALTQIYNRAKFNGILSLSLRNFEVYNNTFTLILFDIDHFKSVNDRFGHNVGDQVLVQLSALVKNQLRDIDTFARWGGEEFIILSESSSANEAYILADRLRKAIESFPFDDVKTITCSFGVTQNVKNDTSIDILKRADTALYHAKSAGRNKVFLEN